MIHWFSFILGIAFMFVLEIIAAIYLLRKFFGNKLDPEEEERILGRLSKEYGDHAEDSK